MNEQLKDNGGDERRSAVNWLSDLARVYGVWHLTVTILQGIIWAGFVAWNEIGDHPDWRDTLQAVGGEVWMALPAFSITSIAILIAVQKGGRTVLTFIDERRQRIRKAREEGREEGIEEGLEVGREEGREAGRAAARSEMTETLRRNSRIDAIIRDNPEIREALRELGFDLRDDEKNGGA